MHGNHGLVDVGHAAVDAGDQLTEFRRSGIAHGVGDVDGGSAGADGGLNHLMHIFRIAATGVLTGELDVVDEGAGVGHHLAGDLQHLGAGFAQFVLQVDVAGGDEGVDATAGRWSNRLGAGPDVAGGGAGQAADHRARGGADRVGDALDGVEITAAGEGEASLNDVDPKAGELLGNGQLLLQIQAGAGRLLAIAEGGVEDQNPTGIARHGKEGRAKRNDYELAPF